MQEGDLQGAEGLHRHEGTLCAAEAERGTGRVCRGEAALHHGGVQEAAGAAECHLPSRWTRGAGRQAHRRGLPPASHVRAYVQLGVL